ARGAGPAVSRGGARLVAAPACGRAPHDRPSVWRLEHSVLELPVVPDAVEPARAALGSPRKPGPAGADPRRLAATSRRARPAALRRGSAAYCPGAHQRRDDGAAVGPVR